MVGHWGNRSNTDPHACGGRAVRRPRPPEQGNRNDAPRAALLEKLWVAFAPVALCSPARGGIVVILCVSVNKRWGCERALVLAPPLLAPAAGAGRRRPREATTPAGLQAPLSRAVLFAERGRRRASTPSCLAVPERVEAGRLRVRVALNRRRAPTPRRPRPRRFFASPALTRSFLWQGDPLSSLPRPRPASSRELPTLYRVLAEWRKVPRPRRRRSAKLAEAFRRSPDSRGGRPGSPAVAAGGPRVPTSRQASRFPAFAASKHTAGPES